MYKQPIIHACKYTYRLYKCTVEAPYCRHHWDPSNNWLDYRGVLNSGVVLYRITTIGIEESVHISGMSAFRGSTEHV